MSRPALPDPPTERLPRCEHEFDPEEMERVLCHGGIVFCTLCGMDRWYSVHSRLIARTVPCPHRWLPSPDQTRLFEIGSMPAHTKRDCGRPDLRSCAYYGGCRSHIPEEATT